MESRKQMTFYSSFWEAINGLQKKDQLPVLRATISYGLCGCHEEKLSVTQAAIFALIKPILDASRKKATGGKHGGSKGKASCKDNESIPQASHKDNASKKENENEVEIEVEVEIENECLLSSTATAAEDNAAAEVCDMFTEFWDKFPNKVGLTESKEAWDKLCTDAGVQAQIMEGLGRWNRSIEWEKENGRFVPRPAKWLIELRWKEYPREKIPQGASGVLGEAELEAVRRLLKEG